MSPRPNNSEMPEGIMDMDTQGNITSNPTGSVSPSEIPLLADMSPTHEDDSINIMRSSSCIPNDVIVNLILEPTLQEDKSIRLQPMTSQSQSTLPTRIWPQVLAALSVSLGSMIIGYGSAYTSTALPTMTPEANSTLVIEKNGHEESWIGSLLPLGALVGGIIGGTLVEKLGRRRTILGTAVPFILSWILIATAVNVWMIYVARAIAGFCVGIASLSLPVYLAETVQPEVRGTLGLLPTAIGNIGILICYSAGYFMNWSGQAYLGAALSVPFLLFMFLIPETPRWHIAHDQEEEAAKALQWLRGAGADIRAEMTEIKNTHIMSQKYTTRVKDLLGKMYMKPLLVSLGLMFFQQFSGINAVIFYTVSIFEMSGSTIDSNLCTVIVGLVNFGAIFIATVLIDRAGRKPLLIVSDSLMIICLGILGGFFYLKEYSHEHVEGLAWIPLAGVMLYVVAFSLGFGPVPWLMMGEIFPGRIRGSAAATATAFNWTCTFIVTKAFPELVSAFGAHSAFLVFTVICIFGLFFIIFYVPETQGQSLEDIERNLTRPFRRISSTANLKPFPMSM